MVKIQILGVKPQNLSGFEKTYKCFWSHGAINQFAQSIKKIKAMYVPCE